MLSDEERKAIKEVKHFNQLTRYWQEEEYEEKEIAEYITIVLNLIEKQSKEIEELTDKNKKLKDKAKELIFEKQELTSALLDSIPNDKIKAKIEEYRKQIEELKDLNIFTYTEYEGAIKFGQSLLEKE